MSSGRNAFSALKDGARKLAESKKPQVRTKAQKPLAQDRYVVCPICSAQVPKAIAADHVLNCNVQSATTDDSAPPAKRQHLQPGPDTDVTIHSAQVEGSGLELQSEDATIHSAQPLGTGQDLRDSEAHMYTPATASSLSPPAGSSQAAATALHHTSQGALHGPQDQTSSETHLCAAHIPHPTNLPTASVAVIGSDADAGTHEAPTLHPHTSTQHTHAGTQNVHASTQHAHASLQHAHASIQPCTMGQQQGTTAALSTSLHNNGNQQRLHLPPLTTHCIHHGQQPQSIPLASENATGQVDELPASTTLPYEGQIDELPNSLSQMDEQGVDELPGPLSCSDEDQVDELPTSLSTACPPQPDAPPRASAFDVMLKAQKAASQSYIFHLTRLPSGRWQWHWWAKGSPSAPSPRPPSCWSCSTVVSTGGGGSRKGPTATITLHTNVPAGEGAPGGLGQSSGGGARQWKGGVPVIKSALQKNVRLGRADSAVRCALWLLQDNPAEFLRRASIICLEDAVLHPALPLLVWIMIAQSKGYDLAPPHITSCLRIVHQMSSVPVRDYLPTPNLTPEQGITSLQEAARQLPGPECALVSCMLLRAAYGGMAGDVAMLRGFAALWGARFKGVSGPSQLPSLTTLPTLIPQGHPDDAPTHIPTPPTQRSNTNANTNTKPTPSAPQMISDANPRAPTKTLAPTSLLTSQLNPQNSSPQPYRTIPPHPVPPPSPPSTHPPTLPPPRQHDIPAQPAATATNHPMSMHLTPNPPTSFTPASNTDTEASNAPVPPTHSPHPQPSLPSTPPTPSPWLSHLYSLYSPLPDPGQAAEYPLVGPLLPNDVPPSAVDFHVSDVVEDLLADPAVQLQCSYLAASSWGSEGDPTSCLRRAMWLFQSSTNHRSQLHGACLTGQKDLAADLDRLTVDLQRDEAQKDRLRELWAVAGPKAGRFSSQFIASRFW